MLFETMGFSQSGAFNRPVYACQGWDTVPRAGSLGLIQRLTQRKRETTDSHLSNESGLSFRRRSLREVIVKEPQQVILLPLGCSHYRVSVETQEASVARKLFSLRWKDGEGLGFQEDTQCSGRSVDSEVWAPEFSSVQYCIYDPK